MTAEVLILGGGVSGRAAAVYFRNQNINVVVSDTKTFSKATIEFFDSHGIEYTCAQDNSILTKNLRSIVVSPGISPECSIVKAAQDKNIPIVTETDIALDLYTKNLVAVTGTNGKSTCVSMINHILTRLDFDSRVGGNIGIPSIDVVSNNNPDILVLELSSYQLEWLTKVDSKISVFYSFADDHLNRHKTLASYFKAKWKIAFSGRKDHIFLTSMKVLELAKKYQLSLPTSKVIALGAEASNEADIFEINKNKLRYNSEALDFPINLIPHFDKENAAFAALTSHLITNHPLSDCLSSLSNYAALPYRMQKVGIIGKSTVYNDSKSTNLDSTISALQYFSNPVNLIIGGVAKSENYEIMLNYKEKIFRVLAFGPSSTLIEKKIAPSRPVEAFKTLKELLISVDFKNLEGDILFSPGGASFDEFSNFEARGEFFNRYIEKHLV